MEKRKIKLLSLSKKKKKKFSIFSKLFLCDNNLSKKQYINIRLIAINTDNMFELYTDNIFKNYLI